MKKISEEKILQLNKELEKKDEEKNNLEKNIKIRRNF